MKKWLEDASLTSGSCLVKTPPEMLNDIECSHLCFVSCDGSIEEKKISPETSANDFPVFLFPMGFLLVWVISSTNS